MGLLIYIGPDRTDSCSMFSCSWFIIDLSNDEGPIGKTAKQYGGATTIHGIPYILDKDRHPLEKLLWIIFVSIGVSLIIYLSESIWSNYQKNPIITSVETTGYNIENIDFPAVTICAQGSMQKVTGGS